MAEKRQGIRQRERLEEECLVEAEEWYFGYGKRSWAGYLNEQVETIEHSLKNHPYPACFSEEFTSLFFDRIQLLVQDYGSQSIPRTAFENDSLLSKSELRSMISYLLFKKLIYVCMEENVEVVQIIRPELLKIDDLYGKNTLYNNQ